MLRSLDDDASFVARVSISPLLVATGALAFHIRYTAGAAATELLGIVLLTMVGGFAVGQYAIEQSIEVNPAQKLRLTKILFLGSVIVSVGPITLISALKATQQPEILFVAVYSFLVMSVILVISAIISEHESVGFNWREFDAIFNSTETDD